MISDLAKKSSSLMMGTEVNLNLVPVSTISGHFISDLAKKSTKCQFSLGTFWRPDLSTIGESTKVIHLWINDILNYFRFYFSYPRSNENVQQKSECECLKVWNSGGFQNSIKDDPHFGTLHLVPKVSILKPVRRTTLFCSYMQGWK